MAIFFALLAFVGWGSGDVFVTIASRKIGNLHTYFWGYCFALILTSFYIPFAGPFPDISVIVIAFLIQIVHTAANIAYFRSLEIGNASLAGTISGGFPLVSVAISMILFGEILTPLKLLGILTIFTGVLLTSFDITQWRRNGFLRAVSDPGVPFALIALLGWGMTFSLIRIPVEKIGWFWSLYPIYPIALCLLFFRHVRKKCMNILRYPRVLAIIAAFIILVTIADFSYNIGILQGYTSTVAPIAGAFPVLFVLLSRIFLKDKLTPQQKIGILIALTGIVLMNLQG